jgi:SSS family solute:Na+ symporter
LTSIKQGWDLVLNIGFGTGAVYILRWYWWRINAWSEISAMVAAAAVTVGLQRVAFTGDSALVYAKSALVTGGITTLVWLMATFVTRPESDLTLTAFYKRVHPSVYGWKRVAQLVPEMPQVRDLAGNTFNWVMGVILVYGCLFGIGKLVFQQWLSGLGLLILASIAGYLIFWDLSRRGWSSLSGTQLIKTPDLRSTVSQ